MFFSDSVFFSLKKKYRFNALKILYFFDFLGHTVNKCCVSQPRFFSFLLDSLSFLTVQINISLIRRIQPIFYCILLNIFNFLFFKPFGCSFSFNKFFVYSLNLPFRLLSSFNISLPNSFSILNWFYFFHFFYLSTLVSSVFPSEYSGFSVSSVFPNYDFYSSHYNNSLNITLQHYNLYFKDLGLFFFVDDFSIKVPFNFSSFNLKRIFYSSKISRDWFINSYFSLFFKASNFFDFSDNSSFLVDFFMFLKSYFKFFVIDRSLTSNTL